MKILRNYFFAIHNPFLWFPWKLSISYVCMIQKCQRIIFSWPSGAQFLAVATFDSPKNWQQKLSWFLKQCLENKTYENRLRFFGIHDPLLGLSERFKAHLHWRFCYAFWLCVFAIGIYTKCLFLKCRVPGDILADAKLMTQEELLSLANKSGQNA